MTQPLFDLDYLDAFLERHGGESPIPLLLGIWPLTSHQLAVRMHNEVPGIVIPDRVQQALLDAGPDAAKVGREIARELLERARDRVAGVYVIAPFRRPLGVLDFLT
jgi:homocysteine S-methyltransferase